MSINTDTGETDSGASSPGDTSSCIESDDVAVDYEFDRSGTVPDGEGKSIEEAGELLRSSLEYDVFSRQDVLDAALDVVDEDSDREEGAYRLVDRLFADYTGSDS